MYEIEHLYGTIQLKIEGQKKFTDMNLDGEKDSELDSLDGQLKL